MTGNTSKYRFTADRLELDHGRTQLIALVGALAGGMLITLAVAIVSLSSSGRKAPEPTTPRTSATAGLSSVIAYTTAQMIAHLIEAPKGHIHHHHHLGRAR
jgi:hypothetical protein